VDKDQRRHVPTISQPASCTSGPVAIYFVMGERATKMLAELNDWMARENAAIMTVLCLIIGAKLIGDAITALAS
jgi:delta-aminolevulinic acid dehydratase/porphobilinogen synthase